MADIERRIRRIGRSFRPRVFRDRTDPLEVLNRDEVYARYRFYPESIIVLVNLLDLATPTLRSMPLPPLLATLVSLHFFASGSHYIITGDIHGVSKASVSRAVVKVTDKILSNLLHFIKMPEAGAETERTQQNFYNVARFPKIIGAIDCTHIRVKAPTQNEGGFVNRKGFHSVNIQVVCNAEFTILDIVARWPGSVHDARIFRGCQLKECFEEGQYHGILIGDSGYPSKPYLLTPYINPSTPAQQRYNDSLTRSRVVIEQTFGVLKRRFACLAYGLRTSPELSCRIITACGVLHNFGLQQGDSLTRQIGEDLPQDEHDGVLVKPTVEGARQRDFFTATFFN